MGRVVCDCWVFWVFFYHSFAIFSFAIIRHRVAAGQRFFFSPLIPESLNR